jgi:hypothetical protein
LSSRAKRLPAVLARSQSRWGGGLHSVTVSQKVLIASRRARQHRNKNVKRSSIREIIARARAASPSARGLGARCAWWIGGRGRVREWDLFVWDGVISEVGWLSLCGAPPRRLFVAPHNLIVWVGESESGRPFSQDGNSPWLGCCCGAGLRASVWRPRRQKWRGAARLRRRVAP